MTIDLRRELMRQKEVSARKHRELEESRKREAILKVVSDYNKKIKRLEKGIGELSVRLKKEKGLKARWLRWRLRGKMGKLKELKRITPEIPS